MPTDTESAADALDMKALQGGDDLALNRLMARHREKVFHYLIRQLQDETEALDLAQETFVRVYLNRHKFDLNQRFTSWMYTIATHLALDRLRKLSRHPHVSLDTPSPQSENPIGESLPENKPTPPEDLQQRERVEEVKQALAELPDDLRTPLVLAEYEDLSQAQISEILQCSTKAVETRIYRARKFLREKLKHLLGEG